MVERPSSVVKELVENAIDAGSTEIVVELKAGGLQLIRVQDNGEGIEAEDVSLALQRYATSKIRRAEDLFNLHTLGFRGEALPSIASVSQLTLTTRVAHSLSGIKAVCEGGEIKTLAETGCPPGTEVEVRQLFYNVPVKRKFLKSIRSEIHHVLNHFLRLGLAYPNISFRLVHDRRVLHDLVKTESSLVRIEAILGREIYQHLQPIGWEAGEIKISGYASLPSMARANADGIYIYVNQRIIKDRIIHKAIVEAYRHVIPTGKFPVVILSLIVPPSAVDVNVHPTKAEVKFRDPDRVFQAVNGALRSIQEPSAAAADAPSKREDRALPQAETIPFFSSYGPPVPFRFARGRRDETVVPEVREAPPPGWNRERGVPIRIVGQVHGTFLVCEGDQALIFIDQHAAHERILFEKLKKQVEMRSFPVVRLLLPLLMEVTAEESFMLSSCLEEFFSIGFEIDPVGEKTFAIRSSPSGIDGEAAQEMIREILEDLKMVKREEKGTEALNTMLVTMACHGAIRANHPLRKEEMEELMNNLNPFHPSTTCPHGRPIFFSLTWDELSRQFRRKS